MLRVRRWRCQRHDITEQNTMLVYEFAERDNKHLGLADSNRGDLNHRF